MNKLLYYIEHSYISLIGGIFLSTGISIFVAIYLQTPEKKEIFLIFLISSILMFISGILWTFLAFKIEILTKSIITSPVNEKEKLEMWDKLLTKNKKVYFILFLVILLSILSIILIPLSSYINEITLFLNTIDSNSTSP